MYRASAPWPDQRPSTISRRPQCDAPIVARLRAAGAVLIGRTNMTEFAFSGVGIIRTTARQAIPTIAG